MHIKNDAILSNDISIKALQFNYSFYKGDLYDTAVANYDILISAVPYCGNNRCQNESSAESECGVSVPCSERI